jgi:hypothetical protein
MSELIHKIRSLFLDIRAPGKKVKELSQQPTCFQMLAAEQNS